MVPGVGPLVNAQNLVDFELLIAKYNMRIEDFMFTPAFEVYLL